MQRLLAISSAARVNLPARIARLAMLTFSLSLACAAAGCRTADRAEPSTTSRPGSAVDQMARDDAAPAREAMERENRAGKRPPPPPAHDYRRGSGVVDQPTGIR